MCPHCGYCSCCGQHNDYHDNVYRDYMPTSSGTINGNHTQGDVLNQNLMSSTNNRLAEINAMSMLAQSTLSGRLTSWQ